MSDIRYFSDGEQATATVLNRPTQDLEKQAQYMSKAQFEALAEMRRNAYAGSGFIQFSNKKSSNDYKINNGLGTGISSNLIWLGNTVKNFYGGSPKVNINGASHLLRGTNYAGSYKAGYILFPNAPTSKGVINNLTSMPFNMKQGDFAILNDSNQKVPNGTFDNLDNWSAAGGGEISLENNALKLEVKEEASSVWAAANTTIKTVQGVEYELSFDKIADESSSYGAYIHINNEIDFRSNYLGTGDEANTHYSFRFIATKTGNSNLGIHVRNDSEDDTGDYVIFDNISVKAVKQNIIAQKTILEDTNLEDNGDSIYTRKTISRQDLVFLESWHENVQDKDIVYPYGNVQYTAGNINGLSNIAEGEFSGADTYSLFGNWQEAGSLVGKGYKWSELSNEDKLKFAQNKENNIYKDNDNIIQVRYRIRVIQGLGNEWNLRENQNGAISCNGRRLIPKMNSVNLDDLREYNTGATYYQGGFEANLNYCNNKTFALPMNGVIKPGTSGYTGYDKKGLSIYIALVQRRNDGAFDPVHNPEGSAVFSDGKEWFKTEDSHNNINDCFANKGDGDIENAKSGRPDGLFYDEINERDVKDLRMSAHKKPLMELLTEYQENAANGNIRGKEIERKITTEAYVRTRGGAGDANYINFTFSDKKGNRLRVPLDLTNDGNQDSKTYGIKFKFLTGEYKDIDGGNGPGIIHARYIRSNGSVFHIYDFENGNGDLKKIRQGDKFRIEFIDKKWNFNNQDNDKMYFEEYDSNNYISNHIKTQCDIIGDPRKLKDRVSFITVDGDDQSQIININTYVKANNTYYKSLVNRGEEAIVIDPDTEVYSDEDNWKNFGDSGEILGYNQDWIDNSINGKPLLVGENGEDYYKDISKLGSYAPGGDRKGRRIQLSRKWITDYSSSSYSNGIIKLIKYKNGEYTEMGSIGNHSAFQGKITDFTTSSNCNLTNAVYVAEDDFDESIYFVYYKTLSNFLIETGNNKVLEHFNHIYYTGDTKDNNKGEDPISNNLLGKVAYNIYNNYTRPSLTNISLSNNGYLNNGYLTTHEPISNGSHYGNSSMVKYLPFISQSRNKLYVQYLYKELKWDDDATSKIYFDTGYVNNQYNIAGEDGEVIIEGTGEHKRLVSSKDESVEKYLEIFFDDIQIAGGIEIYIASHDDEDNWQLAISDISKYVVFQEGTKRRIRYSFSGHSIGRIKIVHNNAETVYVEQVRVVKASNNKVTSYRDGAWGDNESFAINDSTAQKFVQDNYFNNVLYGQKKLKFHIF